MRDARGGFGRGGIPEVVRDGTTGLVVPAGDSKLLAAAIKNLLEKEEQRARMAAECRRIAVEEYSLEIQAKQYVKVYEGMLRGK